ncbi:hypothetical protein [Conexibacter arvalis]|uniref:LPXTG cell wall anchor domain-containing protein n=1 Tax=Conexibacter arvalis TaxID=912552 RepID=A0A840IC61_9ACTN|nr:hypothetical protein [Conexibacter arvalis]MBB4661684.1 hypothetical protein [Conexibacter arvalis]
MKRLALLLAVVAVACFSGAPAYGQSAVGDAYGGNGGGILGTVNNGGGGNGGGGNGGGNVPVSAPAPAAQVQVASESGSLPFTGLDLGLLAVGGIVLVGVGVGLRRFARPLS